MFVESSAQNERVTIVDSVSDKQLITATIERARLAIGSRQYATAIEELSVLSVRFPDEPDTLELLADAFAKNNQLLEALKRLDRIIEIDSATASTWYKMADLLVQVREYAQAIGAFEKSLELEPLNAEAIHDYGRALFKLGDVENAARQFECAAEHCDDIAPWRSLAVLAPGNPEYDHGDILRIRSEFAKRLATLEKPRPDASLKIPRRDRIRVGYFSSWYDHENYMKPVWALLNQHDREKFEIHLFSDTNVDNGIGGYEPNDGDVVRWTGELGNAELVDVIRQAGIDILVDLNAYSTVERLGIFLSRPAPRTIAWFNMYATSGFPGFDFVIGDHVTVRAEEEACYSEKVLRLPQSYLSFIVTHNAPPIVEPPCLKNGYITFGSLVSQYKLTKPVLDSWAQILTAVPSSKLFLGNANLDSPCNRDYLKTKFADRGVDPSRLVFKGRAPHHEFLKYYNSIDIALDAFPYNGGTTTMEAIWQGVPVVTFSGDRWASRTSRSILVGTPAEAFVSDSQQGYVDCAIELASRNSSFSDLGTFRSTMRDALLLSPACDAESLARSMEQIFREIV